MSKKEAIINSFLSILILLVAQGVAALWSILDLPYFVGILFGVTYVFVTYLLLYIYMTIYKKQPLSKFGISKFQIKWRWVVVAVLLPTVVLSLFYLLLPGKIYFNNFSESKSIQYVLEAFFAISLGSGIVEETVFRGIIMTSIKECSNEKWAVFLPSFLFGCLHLINGRLNLSSTIMLLVGGTLVGIMFSLITLYSHSIWASMLVHSTWNFLVIGGIVTFSTTKNPDTILGYQIKSDNLLLTGGEFGIEVSLFAMLGYIAVIGYAYLTRKKRSIG